MKRILLVLIALLWLCGCTQSKTSGVSGTVANTFEFLPQTEEHLAEIIKARDSLLNYPDYIVSHSVYYSDTADTHFLSIRHNDVQYIEYPVSQSGDGILTDKNFNSVNEYALSEYRFSNGDWYSFNYDSPVKFPPSYSKYRDSIKTLYLDNILDRVIEVDGTEEVVMTTSYGEETFTAIDLSVDGEAFTEVLGSEMFSSSNALVESGSDEAFKRYGGWLKEECLDHYACSDVTDVRVLIDTQGRLRGVSLGGSGIGLYATYSCIVESLENPNLREEPDISTATTYENILQEAVTAVKDAKSLKEAANILRTMNLGGE